MKKINLIIFSMFLLGISSLASAGIMPYNINNISDFLSDSKYFDGYSEISSYDFKGEWRYTAIAFESANINITKESQDGAATFSTGNTGNFGVWDTINFFESNLYFEDGNPENIPLDSFGQGNSFFRLYELTKDSKSLDYLANSIILDAGTIIIGFNDNGLGGGDSDFDDIIVAMEFVQSPELIPNPEPATMLLLGFGLIGFAGIVRRNNK